MKGNRSKVESAQLHLSDLGRGNHACRKPSVILVHYHHAIEAGDNVQPKPRSGSAATRIFRPAERMGRLPTVGIKINQHLAR
jgi:hypothetical protein